MGMIQLWSNMKLQIKSPGLFHTDKAFQINPFFLNFFSKGCEYIGMV